jgi:hypothetical protein
MHYKVKVDGKITHKALYIILSIAKEKKGNTGDVHF